MFIPTIRESSLLDRQSIKRSDPAYIEAQLDDPKARILVLLGDKPVIIADEERTEASAKWFTKQDLAQFGLPVEKSYFLGTHPEGGGRFALALGEVEVQHAPDAMQILFPMVDLRSLAMQGIMGHEDLSLFGMAKSLDHWHQNARFCGSCGSENIIGDGGWRRKCTGCGKDQFPRTDPVVIMLIVDPANDRCLLGHEARFVQNMWSTLAGFLEPGEDIANAVKRETFEEAGIVVEDVRFHLTQPWPFPHSLMIGCHAIAKTTEINIDPNEIQEARWFSRNEILLMLDDSHPEGLWVPGKQAIARSLIQAFADGEVQ